MDGINAGQRDTLSVLLEENLISAEQAARIKEASAKSGQPIEEVLLVSKIIEPEEVARAAGIVLGMPYVDMRDKAIPFIILSKFPEEISRKYHMVVFDTKDDKMLKVALAKPWDPMTKKAIEFLQTKSGIGVDPYVTSEDGLEYALAQYANPILQAAPGVEAGGKGVVAETPAAAAPSPVQPAKEAAEAPKEAARADTSLAALVKEKIESPEQLAKIIADSAIPRIVAAIIKYAVSLKASDIHIEPSEGDTRVRYRVDGVLHEMAKLPKKSHPAIVSRIKILAKLKIDEQRIPQDGRIDVVFEERAVDLRISTLPTVNGEKVVARILDKSGGVLTLEQIGVTGRSFDILVESIKKPYGIILVTGPTGSGKSTTLYAILSRLNTESVNIVTVEDPVEYMIPGINQAQVKPAIGFSFAEGLRSILRQDPNIIMVGEIRDRETAEMAIQSALTGHLVLSTLHTNDASGAIPRLIDMGIEPFLITSSLHTIIAQRLVRKICPNCKEPHEIGPAVLEDIKATFEKIPFEYRGDRKIDEKSVFYRGKGCNLCSNTGYKGRIAIFEILRMSNEIEKLAIKRASSEDILKQALNEGMITMKADGVLKVIDGITTMEEVYRVTKI